MTTAFYPGQGFDKYSQQIADSLGGLTAGSHIFFLDGSMVDEPPTFKGNDDEYDAYRHLLLAAKLTESYGADNARAVLDSHEGFQINPPKIQNMDRWNNDVGIKSYQEWKNANDTGQTTDTLEKWLYDKVKQGETINNPYDPTEPRIYDGLIIQPTTWWGDKELQFKVLLEKLFDSALDFLLENDINSSTNDLFNSAAKFVQRRDPLTLDLDGDGLETVGTNAGILFDHNADGIKTGTGWIAPDDGFLVLDRNGNGVIDNGRELFGDATLKSNGQLATDGKIDVGDAQFGNIKVWRDLNQDGITKNGELFTLDKLSIVSIKAANDDLWREAA